MLIADMFTGEWLAPKCDPMDNTIGFDAFWKAWPNSIRKVARAQCLAKWCKHGYWEQAEHIKNHVIWMCAQEEWTKQNGAFIPLVSTYLNQQRWSEWIPETRKTIDPVAATKMMLAERDRNYCPPSQDIKEKLAALRKGMRK